MSKYVEYSIMFQDSDLNRFGGTWDVNPILDKDLAAQYVLTLAEKQAEEQDLEILAAGRADKTVYYDENLDVYSTVYTSAFEQVDIYAVHPPKRFRDKAQAE